MKKIMTTITETSLLEIVCLDANDINEIHFGSNSFKEEEMSLLTAVELQQRRKSSTMSNRFLGNTERKLSVYDLE